MEENSTLPLDEAPEAEMIEDISAETEIPAQDTAEVPSIADDLDALAKEMPSAAGRCTQDLVDEKRYSELRALGLTPKEAFLATAKRQPQASDNRAHLSGSAPKSMHAPYSAMSQAELSEAREIFSGMSDEDIKELYRKVTKHR